MARCDFCQLDSRGPPGTKKEWAPCMRCDRGTNQCTQCTWRGNVRLMCCRNSQCDAGRVPCTQRGCVNGRREVNVVCNRSSHSRR